MTRPSSCGGRSSPDLHKVKKCPQDCGCEECILSLWSKWSSCSCNDETVRWRSIIRQSTCLDKPCPSNLVKIQEISATTRNGRNGHHVTVNEGVVKGRSEV